MVKTVQTGEQLKALERPVCLDKVPPAAQDSASDLPELPEYSSLVGGQNPGRKLRWQKSATIARLPGVATLPEEEQAKPRKSWNHSARNKTTSKLMPWCMPT